MKYYCSLFFVFLVFGLCLKGKSQNEDPILKFNSYHHSFTQEKIYLHFDRSVYTSGETIWFKAYIVDASFHQLDSLGQTFYIELIQPISKEVLVCKKYRINSGTTFGDIKLADTLPTSTYLVRAYTPWMRNFEPELFFRKDIKVYQLSDQVYDWQLTTNLSRGDTKNVVNFCFENKLFEKLDSCHFSYSIMDQNRKILSHGKIKPDKSGKLVINQWVNLLDSSYIIHLSNPHFDQEYVYQIKGRLSLKFYPEGGNIVEGLMNAVAFEFRNLKPGLYLSGEIIDEVDKTICPLNVRHEGRGLFIFRPQVGKKYFAKVIYDEKEYLFNLPDAHSNGVILSAINNYDLENILLTLRKTVPTVDGSNTFMLIAQVRGKIYWAGQIRFEKAVEQIKLSRALFPTGIIQFTLFDSKNNPIVERLVFNQQMENPHMEVSAAKETYQKRSPTKIRVQVTDKDRMPVSANLSVSVLMITNSQQDSHDNIQSYFLLSSDLRGSVWNPRQYFKNTERQTLINLDLLMMTQGWRRFKWEEVLSNQYPQINYPIDYGFDIAGNVTWPWNEKSPESSQVSLLILDESPIPQLTSTDAFGRFKFEDIQFDGIKIGVLQTTNKKGNKINLNVSIDTLNFPAIVDNTVHQTSTKSVGIIVERGRLRKEVELAFANDTLGKMLDEIVVTGRKISSQKEKDFRLYGEAAITINPTKEEASGYAFIVDYLSGRVPGLMVQGSGFTATANLRGDRSFMDATGGGPLFLLDGVPVDLEMIGMIPFQMVESIDILKQADNLAAYGSRAKGGVIAIYLKSGQYIQEKSRGIINKKFKGYDLAKEFYSPDYSKDDPSHIKPDFRSLIYWEPNIVTSNGYAEFDYYNSDVAGQVQVVVEGISEGGIPYVGSFYYEVVD